MNGETCLDVALQILQKPLPVYPLYLQSPMKTMKLELRFCKMFFLGLAYWEESEYDWHWRSAVGIIRPKLCQTVEEFKMDYVFTHRRYQSINWEEISYDLEKSIQQFKPQVKEICVHLLGGAFKCKSCEHNMESFLAYAKETASFIDFILQNLQALIDSNIDLIAPMKQQVSSILQKLEEFRNFAYPVTHSIARVKNFRELMSCTRTWANRLACLACLYWIDGMDESLVSNMEILLSDLMHKPMHYTPGVVASYLESTMIPQLLASYVDFLLQDSIIPRIVEVETLQEGLIFLLSFFLDPPKEESEDKDLILAQIYTIINEFSSLIRSIHFDDMKEGIPEAKFSGFLQKIVGIKAKVRELYVKTQHSSQFNSPKTNAVGFIDSFLGYLNKMLKGNINVIHFVKHQVELVQKGLVSLLPFLENIMEFKNEHENIKTLWTRIIDVVYNADYFIKLCFARSFSVWYGFVGLSNVIEDIKSVKNEIQKIENLHMYKNRILSAKMESTLSLPQVTTSEIKGNFIGFKEDERSLRDHLIRGQKDLTIISISGMPGLGKTTLAKKVYNDPKIQHHFCKIVWCYVSKECKVREILFKITSDLIDVNVKMEFEDLAECLRKCLKKTIYLIVMDDIWDVEVWRQVQHAFPNDKNGSRILFTSRNHDLASQAKPNSISHPLQLFSDEESWELLKEKLFCDYIKAPPDLFKIGKQIAAYCKGLPLAVVLVAALLRRAEKTVAFWNQVAKNLKSYLANEGCGDIIELSYMYLPDDLKSCFLYFGAFERGENVHAKKLKLLWVAEGFIKDNEMQSKEDLANGCLNNLVSQSLVVVTERTSMGKIKKCNIHDLLYDLCLQKASEENFLHRVERSAVFDLCNFNPQKYNHHRICISGRHDPWIKPRPTVTRKELPPSRVHSLLWLSSGSSFSQYEIIFRFLDSFKVLTVLDMGEVYLKSNGFPEVIISIVHLRFLAIKGDNINSIPPSITELWNLETLIMNGFGSFPPLPVSIWKMKSLRHVEIRHAVLHLADVDQETNSFAVHNIETLGDLVLHWDHGMTREFLKKLSRLRKFKCNLNDQLWHLMGLDIFGSLKNLESLRMHYRGWSIFPERLPILFNSHENLKKLALSGFNLLWSEMSTIGKQLPNLQVLKLYFKAFSGAIWNLEDGNFSKLRFLLLSGLNIAHIDVSNCDNPFPCLEQLVLSRCYRLKEIPSAFGGICTLNSIKVLECSDEADSSAMRILEEQRDLGNDSLRVIIRHDDR